MTNKATIHNCGPFDPDPKDAIINNLIEALNFYADYDNWYTYDADTGCTVYCDEIICDDRGEKARLALTKSKGNQ